MKEIASGGMTDALQQYRKDMDTYPMLGRREETKRFKLYEKAKRAETRLLRSNGNLSFHAKRALMETIDCGKQAKNDVLNANLRFVLGIAIRYKNFGVPLLDLIQEGNMGLERAAEKFDYRRGISFRTYAEYWVRQKIQRTLPLQSQLRAVGLSAYDSEKIQILTKAYERFVQKYHREPDEEEWRKELIRYAMKKRKKHKHNTKFQSLSHLTKKRFQKLQQISHADVSLSKTIDEEGKVTFLDTLEDPASEVPVSQVIHRVTVEKILAEAPLTVQEKEVLKQNFGIGQEYGTNLTDVGNNYCLTRQRIGQIKLKALRKLRHWIRENRVL